ncbi:PIG-L deacetylase family protein [Arthrobacter sp. Br18]|uniref:PIG-L deacetylase family protein n=1 Tax=Arthrobacter sp. Br18 TaxID=1312954 RepID=UPI000479C37F|nr:PIG-L deacetylase family protein [Arthrobacter sp. Br18]
MDDSLAMPDDWQRALLIMAHPDDPEYGTAAAVAQWTGAGKDISYLLATRGEAGIAGMNPAEAAQVRVEEQRRACHQVGVRDLAFLDHPDGRIENTLTLRRDIARAIRRHRPDGILTLNFGDTWGPGRWNSSDHRQLGRAVMDGIADAANEWIFPALAEAEGLMPHPTQWVAVASPRPTHWLEVDADSVERAVLSLTEHRLYLSALSDEPVEAQARQQIDRMTGGPEAEFRRVGFELYSF